MASNFGENVGQGLTQRRLTANMDRLRIVGKELEEHEPISCTSLSIIRCVLWHVKVSSSNNTRQSFPSNVTNAEAMFHGKGLPSEAPPT